MAKSSSKSRPKSKAEKFAEKHKIQFGDEEQQNDDHLDAGGDDPEEAVVGSDVEDGAPIEMTSRKPIDAVVEVEPGVKKRQKRRRIRKENDGIYTVETEESAFTVVATKKANLAEVAIRPEFNFREALLREQSKKGRSREAVVTEHTQKWARTATATATAAAAANAAAVAVVAAK